MSNIVPLWEVPRYSRVRIDGVEFEFDHIDGMYSYCTLDDGTVCHLACWSDVEIVRSGRDGTATWLKTGRTDGRFDRTPAR